MYSRQKLLSIYLSRLINNIFQKILLFAMSYSYLILLLLCSIAILSQGISTAQALGCDQVKGCPADTNHVGGLSNVPIEISDGFLRHLYEARFQRQNIQWLPSIKQFERLINSDPILKMNWDYGISQCNNTLPGMTGQGVLDLLDTAVKTPPAFMFHDLVGFPINVIFIEFMQNQNGRSFFSNPNVNQALKTIMADYNLMIQSPKSLKYMNTEFPKGWFSPEAIQQVDYSQYNCHPQKPHYGFHNWNQWFLRQFKLGKRVVGVGSPNGVEEQNIIVNSCQSTPILLPQQPKSNVKLLDTFWLKDDLYSLMDMFGAERYRKHHLAKHFEGGTVYQAFLSALFYHRWHSPIEGIIEDIYSIDGTYFLDQSQLIDYDPGSPNNSQSFLTAVAARMVFVIRGENKKIGKVAIIFIGMAEVSSCVATAKIGDEVQKGTQIGHFAYGGSSHAIIFEKKAKLNFAQTLYSTTKDEKTVALRQNINSFLAEVVSHEK